jgi:predicted secreted protein
MAKLSGKKMLVLVGGVAIGATKSFTLTVNSQTIDTTTKDSDAWGESLYGSKDWNVSVDGLYDPDDPMNAEEIFDAIVGDTRLLLEMAVIDGTGGGLVFKGYANASGLTVGASYNDAVTFTGTLQGDGKLEKGTVSASA